jgi:hypothetical protein
MRISDLENEDWDSLYEMANLHADTHGISNVVIWVGSAENLQHGLRVKVSNTPNRFDRQNNFVIQMPSLDYDPAKVARWIDTDKINEILDWIRINQETLYDYEIGKLDNTKLFIQRLEPYSTPTTHVKDQKDHE